MNTLVGGKVAKYGYFDFCRCPGCGHIQESMLGAESGFLCFACNKHFSEESFSTARARRRIAHCNQCGADVPLSDSWAGGLGYICMCNNYVALHYGSQAVQPETIFDLDWNRAAMKRAKPIRDGRCLVQCRTKKDVLVVHAMQILAQQEDSRFRHFTPEESKGELYVDRRAGTYLGYLIWNIYNGMAALRQLFIMPAVRRHGLAVELVNFWITNVADRFSGKFGIEAPNDKASALHEKLGHITRDGDGYKADKAFFLPSF